MAAPLRACRLWRASPVLRAGRLSGAICVGIALGIFAWIMIPVPEIPKVKLALVSHISQLAAAEGFILPKGFETTDQPGVRIIVAGDIMLDRNVAQRSKQAKDLNYPFAKLPKDFFASADYAVANLEGPVTDRRRSPVKSIDFLFDPSLIPVLKATGIDAFTQANNHALDQGAPGYEDSVRRLREAGFLVFGHQVYDGPIALATTTIHGIKFSFVGYNTTDNPMNKAEAAPVIQQAAKNSDYVIAFMHWGAEYKDRPQSGMIADAHWLIDQGVDVVVGGHPHWTQGFSSYKDKPIAWSLGNFIFDQDFSVETRQGLALALTIKGDKIEIEPIPMQIDLSQPRVVTGDERLKRLDALSGISDEGLRDQIRTGKIVF